MRKKLIAMLTVGAIIVGGMSTTAFAAGGKFSTIRANIKTAEDHLKQSVEKLKADNGIVSNAVEKKKADAGYVKVDKAAMASKLETLKSLRTEVNNLKADIKTAKEAGDKAKVLELRTQLLSKAADVEKAMQDLAPIKEQLKKNGTVMKDLKALKDTLKPIADQRKAIIDADKSQREEIKSLREQLKTAIQQKDEEKVNTISNTLIEKINSLSDSYTQLDGLRDKAVDTVNNWGK